jgi:hypothetical protein
VSACRATRRAALAAAALAMAPAAAPAQVPQLPQLPAASAPRAVRPEARLDAIVSRRATVHAGVGLDVPVSTYVRAEAVLGAGSYFASGGPRFSARAEAIARFALDPLAERPRSPYVGAGLGVRREGGRTRGDVLAVLGVQLRARGRYAPSLELGFGGGVRVGAVLRRVR